MNNQSFAESRQNGPHRDLDKFIGHWAGTTKVYFEPGQVADDSPVEGTIRTILGGRFLLYEYQGSFQGNPLEGMLILGYDLLTNRFQTAWVDSFHMSTGIMYSLGQPGDPQPRVLGSYSSGGENPEEWGWQTDISLNDAGQLLVTQYNIMPTGESVKATETVCSRKST